MNPYKPYVVKNLRPTHLHSGKRSHIPWKKGYVGPDDFPAFPFGGTCKPYIMGIYWVYPLLEGSLGGLTARVPPQGYQHFAYDIRSIYAQKIYKNHCAQKALRNRSLSLCNLRPGKIRRRNPRIREPPSPAILCIVISPINHLTNGWVWLGLQLTTLLIWFIAPILTGRGPSPLQFRKLTANINRKTSTQPFPNVMIWSHNSSNN